MAPRYIDDDTLQAREQDILDHALQIITEKGIISLTMDKLVASVNYSKGTVYNHFSSKEDVMAALCNRNLRSVIVFFERAAAIEGSARDKMTAIGFAYMVSVLLAPHHFALVMSAKNELFAKISEIRQKEHDELDQKLASVMLGIIEDAIDKKELILQSGVDAQQVNFSLWAMSFGTIALLIDGGKVCSTTTGMMLEDRVIEHCNIVMDGMGWAPSKRNNRELLAWLKSDVFAAEIDQLESQGINIRAA